MSEVIEDTSKVKRGMGKLSISPLISESSRDIILLIQEIATVYDNLKDESSILNQIKEEIVQLENYINTTYDFLNKVMEDIRSMEKKYMDELENRENKNNNLELGHANIKDNNLCTIIASKCEEIEKELSNVHDKYALLLEKKKQLLKSMRDSEEVLIAKKKMYQNISMISWSLISDSSIQGHFIPINSPIKTESFQLQINETSKSN